MDFYLNLALTPAFTVKKDGLDPNSFPKTVRILVIRSGERLLKADVGASRYENRAAGQAAKIVTKMT